jgi:epoxyqueuosine reductase
MAPSAIVAVDELREIARAAGIQHLGVASAEPFTDTRRIIEQRRDEGLHGGMQFTYRNPARSTEPDRILEGARSLVVGARSYLEAPPERPLSPAPGRVARYVWREHYVALREGLDSVAERLRDDGWRCRVVADDNALVDREAAYRAGLGWYGKNANILLPGEGSWFVLGAIVTDAPLPTAEPVADECGPCSRCMDSCPTGAIVAPGVVDARRCLAWLVQADGSFPVEFRSSLGDRIYGCDDCQEVCPPNRRVQAPNAPEGAAAWVSLVELLNLTDTELLERFGVWYIPKREPRYLRRNALIALGNSGDPDDGEVTAVLRSYLDDSDPMLVEHAEWAARELGLGDLIGADS